VLVDRFKIDVQEVGILAMFWLTFRRFDPGPRSSG
jgi:hypothetical protein